MTWIYLPKGDEKSGKSIETAMKTLDCLAFGTVPLSFVWAQRRPGNPEALGDGLHGASYNWYMYKLLALNATNVYTNNVIHKCKDIFF